MFSPAMVRPITRVPIDLLDRLFCDENRPGDRFRERWERVQQSTSS